MVWGILRTVIFLGAFTTGIIIGGAPPETPKSEPVLQRTVEPLETWEDILPKTRLIWATVVFP